LQIHRVSSVSFRSTGVTRERMSLLRDMFRDDLIHCTMCARWTVFFPSRESMKLVCKCGLFLV
jgi:hypothetical protein